MRISGWPVMMAGSSDSGSPPLMMVTSAGGSRRTQPETSSRQAQIRQTMPGQSKNAPAKKSAGRVGKWPSRYFDCVGAAGALVGADSGHGRQQIVCRRSRRLGTWRRGDRRLPAAARNRRLHLFLLHLLFKLRRAAAACAAGLANTENQRQHEENHGRVFGDLGQHVARTRAKQRVRRRRRQTPCPAPASFFGS